MLAINQTNDDSTPEPSPPKTNNYSGIRHHLQPSFAQVTVVDPISLPTEVLKCVAELLDGQSFEHALDSFANLLKRQFEAIRVVIAVCDCEGELSLRAISQQAIVNVATAESRLLNEVMREACDLERSVFLSDTTDRLGVLTSHRLLATRGNKIELATMPLFHDEQLQGALLIERSRDAPFDSEQRDLLQMIALTTSPLIALRREASRSLFAHLRSVCSNAVLSVCGQQYPGRRAALISMITLTVLAVLVPINNSIVANAELVPLERRLITSPVDGFIDEISITAGQQVSKDQLLARLDRRDLDLELATRQSELARAKAGFRAAMASHDRQETAVARARLDRERALIDLIKQRIERSELRAPIDGLVISGDLSEVIGMPVGRGDTLFEIAPAEGYEVHLLVHEKDIADIHTGQRGAIAVSADPGTTIEVMVTAIHPVAESGDGAARFRVRASVNSSDNSFLRPGQRGLARLDAGSTTVASSMLTPLLRRIAQWRWQLFG